MTNTRKLIGAAAFSVALGGGGIAGALLGAPGTSGAQTATTSTTVADTDAEVYDGPLGEHLQTAADALGITAEELRAALQDGQTIADIATAEGVDLDTVIDALVTEATANIRDRVTAMVNGELPFGGDHRGPGGRGGFGARPDAVASALGVTEDELRTALEGGQSIAEVASAEGVDLQTVIDALVAERATHLDDEVADGELTADEAAAKKADLEARITELVNQAGGFRGDHGRRP